MRKGFTLIELLIVVSLISILSGIMLGVINVNRVRERAKDGVRKEDLGTISGALERYYSDNNSYPSVTSALVTNYIKTLPTDPDGGAYLYAPDLTNQNYCLCAILRAETTSETHGCSLGSSNYCVINPF